MREYHFHQQQLSKVVIARDATADLAQLLSAEARDGIFLVFDPGVKEHADLVAEVLNVQGSWPFTGGEAAKNVDSLTAAAQFLLEAGANRGSLILGMGGGVTTDFAAFLAAVYMRATPSALLPTSLLAMVDAALGGKNGVDLGPHKNLLGTIRQPDAVIIDPDWLTTLPDDDFRDGLAEVVKTAAMLDAEFFAWLEEHAPAICRRDPEAIDTMVASTAALKMAVVKEDERESKRRMLLNFGHTIGHAWEGLSGFEISHGRAVAAGMVAESRLGAPEVSERIATLLGRCGLPIAVSRSFDSDEVWALMQRDKKTSQGKVRIALPVAIGRGEIRTVDRDDLERALA